MKVAMGALAVLATLGGLLFLPIISTHPLETFLAPAFGDSPRFEAVHPSDTLAAIGLVIGTVLGLTGIAIAHFVWVRRPGTSAALIKRFPRVHALLVNQWYFDQILDTLFVRPAAWFGRWASSVVERAFVQGTLVDGTTSIVRAGSAVVRQAQSGLLRGYVALLVLGMAGVALYFLLQS
jgi:NADH-quinone oxidoreductase subunit L